MPVVNKPAPPNAATAAPAASPAAKLEEQNKTPINPVVTAAPASLVDPNPKIITGVIPGTEGQTKPTASAKPPAPLAKPSLSDAQLAPHIAATPDLSRMTISSISEKVNVVSAQTQPVFKLNGNVTKDNVLDYVFVQESQDKTYFLFRGVCLKCGWQTSAPHSKDEAVSGVLYHLQRHILGR